MTFGEKLQALRKQHNISQEELAEKLGASRTTVSKWETDQRMPEADKLLAISEMFLVSIDYLLKNELDDTVNTANHVPLTKLFGICMAVNILGLVASMYGWHRLQSPFLVLMGLLMNILACLFFEIFHPRKINTAIARYTRKRFYAANALILLPIPIYVAVELISFGEHYDTVAPHFLPFVIYIIVAVGITIYLVYQNKK